jgi:hypothetical protein
VTQLQRRIALSMLALGVVAVASHLASVGASRLPSSGGMTYTCNSGTACVSGKAMRGATDGVFGSTTSGNGAGVLGTGNNAGVTGYTSSTNGGSGVSGVSTSSSGTNFGVTGKSQNGPGVYGTSSAGDGLDGVSTASNLEVAAIYAEADSNGNGIFAESNDSSGAYGALYAFGDNKNTYLFYVYNFYDQKQSEAVYCQIDPNAALFCSGGIAGAKLLVRHRDDAGHRVQSYALESAARTIQDSGTARMVRGVGDVTLDPAFASVTDRRWYYVFLTPLGETRGLYVSRKTALSFQVRETEGGRDSLTFDYRIVAHPLDASYDRLPSVR